MLEVGWDLPVSPAHQLCLRVHPSDSRNEADKCPNLAAEISEKINPLNHITRAVCSTASNTPPHTAGYDKECCLWNVHFLLHSVWSSMGKEKIFDKKGEMLLNGQINSISYFLLVSFFCLVGGLNILFGAGSVMETNCFSKNRDGFLQKFQGLTLCVPG